MFNDDAELLSQRYLIMESRAKLLGHSIHQMLIVFPLGLLATAVIFDILFLFIGEARLTDAAYWMILAGIISGLIAAVFGVIDWAAIPSNTRAKRVGLAHAAMNVLAITLFAVSWGIRYGQPADPPVLAFVFSFIGAAIAVVGGWLGGELVNRLGVGVDDGANLNAPNSLSGKPASATHVPRS